MKKKHFKKKISVALLMILTVTGILGNTSVIFGTNIGVDEKVTSVPSQPESYELLDQSNVRSITSYDDQVKQLVLQEHERPFGADENHNPLPDYFNNDYFKADVQELILEPQVDMQSQWETQPLTLPINQILDEAAITADITENINEIDFMAESVGSGTIYFVNSTTKSITVSITIPAGATNGQMQIYHTSTGWVYYPGNGNGLANGTYTFTGLAPYSSYGIYLAWILNGEWGNVSLNDVRTQGDGSLPSEARLEAINITSTSFDLVVQFPTANFVTNTQVSVTPPTGQSYNLNNTLGLQNGTYPFNGLSPGSIYKFSMWWIENGAWQNRSLTVTTTLPPEVLVRTDGRNVFFNLEAIDTDTIPYSSYLQWIGKMDTVYDNLKELTGYTPYNGEKIEIRSTRAEPGYWAAAGNPITWPRIYIPKQLNMVYTEGDWSFGIMHELGHDFDTYKWNFDSEFFANLKMAYAIDQNNAKAHIGYMDYYTGMSGLLKYYKSDSDGRGGGLCYDKSIALGIYDHDGLTYTFLRIQQIIGWEPFKQTFRFFNDLAYNSVPTTNLGKLNLFLSKLTDFSGQDVFAMLNSQEKSVYGAKFGGVLEYEKLLITVNVKLLFDSGVLSGEYMDYLFEVINDVKYSFVKTFRLNFAITTAHSIKGLKSLCNNREDITSLCKTKDHHNWTRDANTPSSLLNDCNHHSSAAYMLWELSKMGSDSGLITMYTLGLLCRTEGNVHKDGINGIALPPGYDGIARGNESVIGLGDGYWRDVRYTQHEWSHNYGAPDSYPPNPDQCTPGQWCIMRQDYYNITGYETNIWCDNCIDTIDGIRDIH